MPTMADPVEPVEPVEPADPVEPTRPQIYQACLLCIARACHHHTRANKKIPPVRVCVCRASYGIFKCVCRASCGIFGCSANALHVDPHTQRYVRRDRETLVFFDAENNGSRCTLEITRIDYEAWCGLLELPRRRTARHDDLAQRVAEIEAQRVAEIEAQRVAEIEAQRVAEIEAQRVAEIEAQRVAEIEAQQVAEIRAQRHEYAQKEIDACTQRKANGSLAVKLYTLIQLTHELSEMSLVPIEARNELSRLANNITTSPMQFVCLAECMVCLSEKDCFYSPQCGHALSRYCWDCYVALPSNHKCLARQSDCPYSQSNARLVQ
jgi:hypothetical protein